MSNARLKTRIKNLVRDHLREYGFSLWKPRIPERTLEGFVQGIEFQPGTGYLSGRYTLNVYWRFTIVRDTPGAFDGCQRIGELMGGGSIWFSREADALDPEFERAKEIILTVVIPYFERYRTIPSILKAVDDGELDARIAFGLSIDWTHFNHGCCHAFAGNPSQAIEHLRLVVDEYSDEPLDFVQKRKEFALTEIERLASL